MAGVMGINGRARGINGRRATQESWKSLKNMALQLSELPRFTSLIEVR
jgi:hypothetical protein